MPQHHSYYLSARNVSIARARGPVHALAVSMLVTCGILVLNLLTGILLARKLGPAGRGELTAVLLWPSLLAVIGSLGVSDAITFFAARRSDIGKLVGGALSLAAAQSVVLLLVGFAIEPLVLHRYGRGATTAADILLVGFVPTSLVAMNLLGVINGRQRLVSYQLLRGLVILVSAVALGALAVAHALTIRSAIYCYVAGNAVTMTAVALEVWLRDRPHPKISREQIRGLAVFGTKSQTSNVSVLLNARLDQLLVSVFLAPRALGLYTVASTLGSVVSMVGYSVAPVALPVVAAQVDPVQRRDRARAMVSITVLLSTALAVPLIVFVPPLIDIVFGGAFHGAATAARILLASSVVFSVNRALEAVLKAVGRPLDAGLAETISLVVTALSLAILIPLGGLPGVATASMVAGLTSCALLVSRAHRALRVSVIDLLPRASDIRNAIRLLRAGAGELTSSLDSPTLVPTARDERLPSPSELEAIPDQHTPSPSSQSDAESIP